MMPPEGGAERGEQLATLERLAHERATGDEVGEWLTRSRRRTLNERRRARSCASPGATSTARGACPAELAAEIERASAEGQTIWQAAREANDFAAFAPALRRNVELAREYAACFEGFARPYDALLADYDFGLTAARVQDVFGELSDALPPLVADAARTARGEPVAPPVEAQQLAVPAVLRADRRGRRRLAHRRLGAPVQRRRRARATAA